MGLGEASGPGTNRSVSLFKGLPRRAQHRVPRCRLPPGARLARRRVFHPRRI